MVVQSRPVGSPAAGLPRRSSPAVRGSPPRRSDDAPAPAAPLPTSPSIARRPSSTAGLQHDQGVGLLLVFLFATLIMLIAVALVGAAEQWWILVPVMLAHLAVTFAVIATIARMLGGGGQSLH